MVLNKTLKEKRQKKQFLCENLAIASDIAAIGLKR